jgi:predicted ATPase
VAFLIDSIPTSRVLCLCTYRPGYVQPFGERTYHTRMVLPTLTTADSIAMAEAMLGTKHLPEALRNLIIHKAEGNPFFVEEVVKSLQEVGAIRQVEGRYVLARSLDEIEVPDTIQDVIMARIDRLEEAPKKTLQLASVIGREFTHRLLDRLADIRDRTETYLHELKAIELIYEKRLFPELAYMFKHALTQDVAYHSLLEQRRQELHRLIGQAIEDLYTDWLAEQYAVMAYHFAKGEAWAKALDYFLKAAGQATQAFATLVGRSYQSALLRQCLGPLKRIGAHQALFPAWVPAQVGHRTSIDGPMIASWRRVARPKGKISMRGRIMAGSQALIAHPEAGQAVFVASFPVCNGFC